MNRYDENSLLERLRNDDEEAFSLLFERYYVPLCRYSRLIVRSEDPAEEVVVGLFIYLWEKRAEIRIRSSLCSYLFRSVRNRSLNYLRDVDPTVRLDDAVMELWSEENRTLEIEELNRFIEEAILSLPARCRDVFLQSRSEDLSNREIAIRLNISVKTVEAQISKALKIIRRHIAGKLGALFL